MSWNFIKCTLATNFVLTCYYIFLLQLIQHLLEKCPTQLHKVVLRENKIKSNIIENISSYLEENDDISDTFSIESMKIRMKSSNKMSTSKSFTQNNSTVKSSDKNDESSSDDEEKTEKTDREKEEESDMKDTVKTDEDYRVLEMALEEGLSTGKISALSGTMEEEEEEMEEEELTEVPLTSTTPIIKFPEKKPQTFSVEEFGDDGDELKEIPIFHHGTV